MKQLFTTKSGLQIGLLATKSPPPFHDQDAIKLQRALLNEPAPVDKDGLTIVIGTLSTIALVAWLFLS